MLKVTIEEYDLTHRRTPFKFKKVGEFRMGEVAEGSMYEALRKQLTKRGYSFMSGKEFRFWSVAGTKNGKLTHVVAVVGNAEELAKLDYDANYA